MTDSEITRKNAAIAAFFCVWPCAGEKKVLLSTSRSVESVPAPLTLFLLGVGLLGIAAARRRQ